MPSYRREVYDGSRGTARMSDLLMSRGQNQANLALRQGDIAAQNAQNIGGIIGQTAMSLAKQGEARRAQAAEDARQKKTDARNNEVFGWQRNEQMRRETAQKQADATAGQDLNERVTSSRFINDDGTYNVAGMKDAFEKAGIGDRFPSMLDKARRTDANVMQMKSAQIAFAKAQEGVLDDFVDDAEHAISLRIDPLTAVRTQVEKAKKLGFNQPFLDDIQAKAEGDPEKIPTLLASLRKPREADKGAAKPGSFEDYVVRVARDKGIKHEQLSPRDITAAKSAYDAAGRAPKGDGGDPSVTPSARNTATRWRDGQFATIDADAKREIQREADRLRQGGGVPLTDAEFAAQARPQLEKFKRDIYDDAERKKRDVVRSYQDQLGGEVGSSPVAPAAPAPTAPRPMSDVRPMRSNAAPAPTQPRVPGAPEVGSIVTRKGVRYRIEQVNPDGTVKATPLE